MARILVVEDYPNIQSIYQSSLSHDDNQVDAASDGAQALTLVGSNHYDVILLDLLMPNMDGLEFLRQAKLTKVSPDTKVIILSNVADAATLQEATDLGATQYLVKAKYSPSEVVEAVEALAKPKQSQE